MPDPTRSTGMAGHGAWVLRPIARPEARLRLLCVPYAGAGPAIYRTWPQALPPWIEPLMVQLPGRQGRLREAPLTRMRPLVEALTVACGAWLDRPLAVFGYSLGALIGFELAHALRERYGVEPCHLFVGARRAPQLPDPEPPLHHLPDDIFVDELGRRYEGIPTAVLAEPDLLKLLLPALRADFELLATYAHRPRPPLHAPLGVFGGRADPRISRADLRAWRAVTTGPFTLRLLPGDHFFLNQCQAELIRAVVADLADGDPDSAGGGDRTAVRAPAGGRAVDLQEAEP